MNFSNLTDIVIGLVVVGYVIYKQFTWQLVSRSNLWRMPVILLIVGVVMLDGQKALKNVTPVDLAILGGEVVLSLALGAAMGSLAQFRTRGQRESDVRNRSGQPTSYDPSITVVESRTGAVGVALWIVLIVVRIGIELIVAHFYPASLVAATGTILIVIAANRAARAFVVFTRMERRALIPA
jgi:hypothetical protein